jgi:hypothetical protein
MKTSYALLAAVAASGVVGALALPSTTTTFASQHGQGLGDAPAAPHDVRYTSVSESGDAGNAGSGDGGGDGLNGLLNAMLTQPEPTL